MKRALLVLAGVTAALAASRTFAADQTVTLAVDNMYCEACPYIVQQTLARVAGVESVVVSYQEKRATVTYDDRKTTLEALTAATTQAGYPSRPLP